MFQNVAAHLLRDPKHAIDCDILVCGNDVEAKKVVMGLVTKMGMHPYDVGPAESAPETRARTNPANSPSGNTSTSQRPRAAPSEPASTPMATHRMIS